MIEREREKDRDRERKREKGKREGEKRERGKRDKERERERGREREREREMEGKGEADAVIVQWYCAVLLVNRFRDPTPGAWFIPTNHFISPGCPRPIIALRCRIYSKITHFIFITLIYSSFRSSRSTMIAHWTVGQEVAIDPKSGACFKPKLISLAQVVLGPV